MTAGPANGTRAAEVRLRNVSKRYGNVTAVKPLDLTIPPGSLVTLLGPSGCGKTTLLRMIAGLERVSQGEILIGGQDVTQLSAGERNVSMVFQSYALFPHMNVLENVAYGLISGGTNKKEARARAEGILELVGLKGFGPRLPSEMSGGQQQRVAVARALVLKPDVLLFDEPLSNLDARLRRSMREEIRALQQELGVTVVYVTHDQSEALAVSDLIVVMRAAEIAQIGTPRELYAAPDNVFVATFMGEANHVKGMLAATSASSGIVSLDTLKIELPHRNLPAGKVDVVIRPEAIRLVAADGNGCLRATVRTSTYMGTHAEYNLDTPVGSLFCVAPEAATLRKVGEVTGVMLDAGGVFAVRA
jgi:iron(III) transport system ATP-binding protein